MVIARSGNERVSGGNRAYGRLLRIGTPSCACLSVFFFAFRVPIVLEGVKPDEELGKGTRACGLVGRRGFKVQIAGLLPTVL